MKRLNWSDCTVGQYLDVQELIAQKDITPTDFVLGVGDVFLDLDEDITDKELREVKNCIAFIGKPIVCALNTKNLKPFNKLSIARFIDLDVTLVMNNFVDAVPMVAKMLYGLGDEVFKLPITDVFKAVESFIQYRLDVYKKYPNIFDSGEPEEGEEVEEDEPEQKPDPASAWLKVIFGMSQGDITNYSHIMGLSHILVFNWVSLSESLKPRQQSGTV
jgi:hypothetical protein